MERSEIKIYKTPDGKTSIEVKFEKETVWLSQKQMAELFDKDSDTIGLHLKNIYKSGELEDISTTEKYSVVRQEGKRKVKREIKFYNLDAIISVGYRVNSKRGVLFRKWATQLLKDYLIKGFAINQQQLQKQTEQLNKLKETYNRTKKPALKLSTGFKSFTIFTLFDNSSFFHNFVGCGFNTVQVIS